MSIYLAPLSSAREGLPSWKDVSRIIATWPQPAGEGGASREGFAGHRGFRGKRKKHQKPRIARGCKGLQNRPRTAGLIKLLRAGASLAALAPRSRRVWRDDRLHARAGGLRAPLHPLPRTARPPRHSPLTALRASHGAGGSGSSRTRPTRGRGRLGLAETTPATGLVALLVRTSSSAIVS